MDKQESLVFFRLPCLDLSQESSQNTAESNNESLEEAGANFFNIKGFLLKTSVASLNLFQDYKHTPTKGGKETLQLLCSLLRHDEDIEILN